MTAYPQYNGDLYSTEALMSPFEHYKAIRDLGSVVHLPTLDVLAISRHADVQAALRHADILISGEGVGFNDFINPQPPERGPLTSDGDRHRRLRSTLIKPLMPAALKQHREMLKAMIVKQVRSLADGSTFNAVDMISQFLPLNAVTSLVGLADQHRSRMLEWATAFFNLLGPLREDDDSKRQFAHERELGVEIREFFASVDPSTFEKGSWSAELFATARERGLTEGEMRGALRAFVIPSLDTTILNTSGLLHSLATHPEQWKLLQQHPELVPSAVLEAVRYCSVARAFSRFAQDDYSAGDVYIPKGQRVMIMFAAANHDERHYASPEKFDVTRNPTDHLGWGTGPHMCAGMHLARMEMEVLLEALLETVDRIEVGEPDQIHNYALYGFSRLPLSLHRR